MKHKKTSLVILFLFCVTSIVIALSGPVEKDANKIVGSVWKFKSVVSENPATTHYVSTIYEESEYFFAHDHSYSGSFFGMAVSGTWEINGDVLLLNKGTNKEEQYKFTVALGQDLVLESTEKGDKVFITFERH